MTGTCPSCGQPATLRCSPCLDEARRLLAEVVIWHTELPAHLGAIGSSLGGHGHSTADGRPLPGGDALVLLGPGAAAEQDWAVRRGDPPSVLFELNRWQITWGGPSDGQVWRAAQWLRTHSLEHWRKNSNWDQFLNDLRRLHGRLEAATGRRRNPTRANASCFECGGVLLRLVDDKGLEEDHVTCQKCHTRYDEVRYRLALRTAAEEASQVTYEGELWETAARLSARLSRSGHTLAAWRRDGRVRTRTWSGQAFFNVADVEREHNARKQRATG